MTMSRTLSLEPSPFHLNLKWKKQFCFPRTHHTLTSSISIPNNIKSQNNAAIKFKFKCHLNQNHKTSSSSITSNSKPKSLLESLATTIWNTLRKPAVAAAMILFLLTTYNPNTSLAASGGRMGGRAFSKSSSSTSTSYSSPSSSSSSSSSGSYSSPSSSSSSSSWSYSAPSRRSRSPSPDFSYSRSYWDKPSSSKSYWDEPSPSPSRVEPPSQPSPEFSYSSSESSPSRVEPAVVDSKFDAAVLFLICVGFLALFLASAFLSDRHEEERSVPTAAAAGKTTVPKLQQNQAISDPDEGRSVPTAAGITTILKLQVGLLGTGRSLQRDLNRIAEVADTSSPEGLNYILTETSLALIRHPDYCISGYSSVDIKQGIEEGEERFNQLSIEERGKFDEETLVNVDNIKRQSTRSQRSDGCSNEYIVITILAAAEGEHKLPSINGSGNLKEALQKLGSIPSSKLLAVEVLWTPQDENDTLLEQELLEDYPLLQPF